MNTKTWQEHLESTVSEMQIVSSLTIQQAMQDEIDELRQERDHLAAALEATALKEAELTVELYELKKDLIFVERWANHHGTKSCHSAESILGVIQHYPTIKAITKSYADGVLPTTPDPYAERDGLAALVTNVHKARGRYHSQLAMCALYDAVGLPNVRPISGQKEFGEKHD